jgi:hypothetical protein
MGVTGECDPGHDSCQFGPYGADESICLHRTPRARLVSPFREGQCQPTAPVV